MVHRASCPGPVFVGMEGGHLKRVGIGVPPGLGRGDAYREGTCAPRPPHRVPRRMRGGQPAARGAVRRRSTVRRSRRTACTRRRRAAAAVDGSVVSSSWDTLPPEGVVPAGRSGAPRTLHAPPGPPHPSTANTILATMARGSPSRVRRQRHRAALPRPWEHRRLDFLPRDAWERHHRSRSSSSRLLRLPPGGTIQQVGAVFQYCGEGRPHGQRRDPPLHVALEISA